MKLPRPGPDIGPPQREHVVLGMLITLCMCEPSDQASLQAALSIGVNRIWGWSEQDLEFELKRCKEVMVENGGRLTCWFTPNGIEFDFNIPQ